MRNLYHIRTLGGMPVRVHYSWLIFALLGLVALPQAVFPAYLPELGRLPGLLLALLVLALYAGIVLVHALAQIVVARLVRVRFPVLNLYPLGAITRLPDRGAGSRASFAVAAAGPLASAALWWALDALSTSGTLPFLWLAVALYVAARLSLYLALINLLPGLPLDGGRLLRAALWWATGSFESATRAARVSGQIVAYGLVVWGALSLLADGDLLLGGALVLLGWAIRQAGGTTYRRALIAGLLKRLTAADVLRAPERTIAPGRSLREFAALLRGRTGAEPTPVVANGMFLGMIDRDMLWEVPQGHWDERTVAEAMLPAASLPAIEPETPVARLLPRLMHDDIEREIVLPVTQEGRLAGVIDAEELGALLELEGDFGLLAHHAPATAERAGRASRLHELRERYLRRIPIRGVR
jgi:Zn-dependent protease